MNKLAKTAFISIVTFTALAIPTFAQTDPTAEITAIVERIVTIVTQVGSGVLILYIVKDAFDLLQNKDNPAFRGVLLRDIFLLVIAAIFLFKPQFILDAIKFIANA